MGSHSLSYPHMDIVVSEHRHYLPSPVADVNPSQDFLSRAVPDIVHSPCVQWLIYSLLYLEAERVWCNVSADLPTQKRSTVSTVESDMSWLSHNSTDSDSSGYVSLLDAPHRLRALIDVLDRFRCLATFKRLCALMVLPSTSTAPNCYLRCTHRWFQTPQLMLRTPRMWVRYGAALDTAVRPFMT